MLADGTVSMMVEEQTADYAVCRVIQGGIVRSRQGVNLPGARLSVAALSDADRDAAVWAAVSGIDFVSLSFVRTSAEVLELKALLRSRGSAARVIAKIEKPEALQNLDEIVQAADGVMVARGDLGVEIDVAEMPVAQKRIVATCTRYQKPVIIATQMLDSMQHCLQPTRAEVTDVANAILDGGDACMLSGETAIGEHPRAAVEMMQRIALATEPLFLARPPLPAPDIPAEELHPITQAMVYGAGHVARQLGARLIVVASHSGITALALSKLRTFVPVLGVSDSEATLRQMCLYWGVTPLPGASPYNSAVLLERIVEWARGIKFVSTGDHVVFVHGTMLPKPVHNMMVVHQVE
jgi:pyruvate kinase